MLEEWKMALDLRFILPRGSGLEWHNYHLRPCSGVLEGLRIGPLVKSMTLTVEPSAELIGRPLLNTLFEEYEISVICLPDSFVKYDINATDAYSLIRETKSWTNPKAELDYLIGIDTLLKEEKDLPSLA
jgi:hypothetical protein